MENSGPPVDAAAAARLTEPFERLGREADARGAGLGLSIVSAVSRAHGGSLSIEPRPGGGLVVSVRLPGSREAARRAEEARRDARAPGSRPALESSA